MDSSIAENSTIYLRKTLILNLNFQGEGHFFANCLFYILIISRKYLSFQFLTFAIHVLSHPNRG